MDEHYEEGSLESRHSSADYMKFRTPGKPKKRRPGTKVLKVLTWLIVAAILIAGAYLVYTKLFRHKTPAPKPASQTAQTASQAESAAPKTTATKHYDSATFGLGIDYPADWTVVEASGANRALIHSEPMQLTLPSGQKKTGQIVLTLNLSGQNLTMFDPGNAGAVRDSKKISYSHPTNVQRGETYLSFLQYPATTAANALDGVYITGDFGYLKDQAIPKVDIAKANPLITLTFLGCTDKTCSGAPTPIAIDIGMWDTAAFAEPLETMLRSITII